MTRQSLVRGIAVAAGLAVAMTLPAPQPAAAATGPYTLPFFNPAVTVTQPFGCTGYHVEPAFGGCAHWHAGIDYSVVYAPVAATRAGWPVRMLEAVRHDAHDDPRGGNYVLLDHGGSRFTLYYHLEENGVYPALYEGVSAGQQIAISGNTGASDGAHLHYALTSSVDWWVGAYAINPNGQWTTDPGRVPWLAAFHSESYGGTVAISQWSTRTHWVRFVNIGGRPWTNYNDGWGRGGVFLAATPWNGYGVRSSAFQAWDWTGSWLATWIDERYVPPGGVGTFTFGLRAAPPPGYYVEYFNLGANGLWWFDHARLGSFYVPIQVVTSSCSKCL